MTFNYDDLSPVCRSENLGKHYFGFWVKKGYVSKSLLVDNEEEEAVRLHKEYMEKDKYSYVSELNEFELTKKTNYAFAYVRNIEGGN